MSMSTFIQHDLDGLPLALDSQQAVLLELLGGAEGKPVSCSELQKRG